MPHERTREECGAWRSRGLASSLLAWPLTTVASHDTLIDS